MRRQKTTTEIMESLLASKALCVFAGHECWLHTFPFSFLYVALVSQVVR